MNVSTAEFDYRATTASLHSFASEKMCGVITSLACIVSPVLLLATVFGPSFSHATIQFYKDQSYYEILSVGETAKDDEIKSKFRQLAKEYHPDRNPGDQEALMRFSDIAEAYGVLSDAAKREKYDLLTKHQQKNPESVSGFYDAQGKPYFSWQEPPMPRDPWNVARPMARHFIYPAYLSRKIEAVLAEPHASPQSIINGVLKLISEDLDQANVEPQKRSAFMDYMVHLLKEFDQFYLDGQPSRSELEYRASMTGEQVDRIGHSGQDVAGARDPRDPVVLARYDRVFRNGSEKSDDRLVAFALKDGIPNVHDLEIAATLVNQQLGGRFRETIVRLFDQLMFADKTPGLHSAIGTIAQHAPNNALFLRVMTKAVRHGHMEALEFFNRHGVASAEIADAIITCIKASQLIGKDEYVRAFARNVNSMHPRMRQYIYSKLIKDKEASLFSGSRFLSSILLARALFEAGDRSDEFRSRIKYLIGASKEVGELPIAFCILMMKMGVHIKEYAEVLERAAYHPESRVERDIFGAASYDDILDSAETLMHTRNIRESMSLIANLRKARALPRVRARADELSMLLHLLQSNGQVFSKAWDESVPTSLGCQEALMIEGRKLRIGIK